MYIQYCILNSSWESIFSSTSSVNTSGVEVDNRVVESITCLASRSCKQTTYSTQHVTTWLTSSLLNVFLVLSSICCAQTSISHQRRCSNFPENSRKRDWSRRQRRKLNSCHLRKLIWRYEIICTICLTFMLVIWVRLFARDIRLGEKKHKQNKQYNCWILSNNTGSCFSWHCG